MFKYLSGRGNTLELWKVSDLGSAVSWDGQA